MSAGQENSLTFKRHRKYTLLPPANVVYKGYVFTGVCLSPGGGGCVCAIPACIAGGIPACLAAGRGGGLWVSQHALLKGIWFRPTAKGEVEGDLAGGVPAPGGGGAACCGGVPALGGACSGVCGDPP